jgi:hypothetical protein
MPVGLETVMKSGQNSKVVSYADGRIFICLRHLLRLNGNWRTSRDFYPFLIVAQFGSKQHDVLHAMKMHSSRMDPLLEDAIDSGSDQRGTLLPDRLDPYYLFRGRNIRSV